MDAWTTLIDVLKVLLPTLVIYWLIRRDTKKQMESITEEFKPLVSKVFGMAGAKGADAKAIKGIEQAVADDVSANIGAMFPEVELVLGWLSPDTLEKIKERPEALPILLQRYGPLIAQFAGKATGRSKEKSEGYDFG